MGLDLDPAQPGQITVGEQRHLHGSSLCHAERWDDSAPHAARLPRPPRRRGPAHVGHAWRAPRPRGIASWSSSRPTASWGWHRRATRRGASRRAADGRAASERTGPGCRAGRAPRLRRQRARPGAAAGPAGRDPLRPGRHRRGGRSGWPRSSRGAGDVLLGYEPTAATATRTTRRCTTSARRAAELAGTPSPARGDRAARHDLPRHRPGRQGLPLPAGVRPARVSTAPSRHAARSPTGSASAATSPPSAPRCAPMRPRRAPTAGPTARSPPSSASPARSTTSSSAGSGSSTRSARPGDAIGATSSPGS